MTELPWLHEAFLFCCTLNAEKRKEIQTGMEGNGRNSLLIICFDKYEDLLFH